MQQIEKFLASVPEIVRPQLRRDMDEPMSLDFATGIIQDCLADYFRTLPRRPALPHERERRGNCMILTRKGEVKYRECLEGIARAFEEAFGLRIEPVEGGPLDVLQYC